MSLYLLTRRVADLLLAGFGLVIAGPIILGISVVVRLSLGRPIFFRQVRPGLEGREFTVVKFRTMRDVRDSQRNLLPDPPHHDFLGHPTAA